MNTTATEEPPAESRPGRRRRLHAVGTFVDRTASRLEHEYLSPHTRTEQSKATADLAKLRRALGHDIASAPEVFGIVLSDSYLDTPPEPSSIDAVPEEKAAFIALTLFGSHQQSQTTPMHRRGNELGPALRSLSRRAATDKTFSEDAVQRRFDALMTSDDLAELTHHLRGLVGQLRSSGIALDYGTLADDLTAFQDPEQRQQVRLRWGRGFYNVRPDHTEND